MLWAHNLRGERGKKRRDRKRKKENHMKKKKSRKSETNFLGSSRSDQEHHQDQERAGLALLVLTTTSPFSLCRRHAALLSKDISRYAAHATAGIGSESVKARELQHSPGTSPLPPPTPQKRSYVVRPCINDVHRSTRQSVACMKQPHQRLTLARCA